MQQAAAHAGVVAGREPGAGPETLGQLEHRVEAHVAVAAHAWVRRQPRGVVVEEGLDDAGAELLAQVEGEVRDAHSVRQRPGAAHRLSRAARALAVVGRIGPQLEGDRRDIASGARLEQRGDGAVHAAAHGDEDAAGHRRQAAVGPGGGAEPARQGVGGKLGGVALGGAQATELVGDVVRADAERVEQPTATDEGDRRAPRGQDRAAAGGVEPGVGDALARDCHRNTHQVAAGGAAGGAAGRTVREVAAPDGRAQMLGEFAHAGECSPRLSAGARRARCAVALAPGERLVHSLADLGPVRVPEQRACPVPAIDDDDGRRLEHLDAADRAAEERDLPHRGRDDERPAAVRGHVGELRAHAAVVRCLPVPEEEHDDLAVGHGGAHGGR